MVSGAEIAGCIGKVRHETATDARCALRYIQTKRHTAKGARIYRCVFCSGWHVGNDDARRGPLPVRETEAE